MALCGRLVGCKHDGLGLHGVRQADLSLLVVADAVDEVVDLLGEGVVGHIAAVRRGHRDLHVVQLTGNLLRRVELVVQQGTLISVQMQVEDVRGDGVVTAADLGHGTVGELQDHHQSTVELQVFPTSAGSSR